GFMRGQGEHGGNRAYFGVENIQAAPAHPIHANLRRIANLRRQSPALQRGVQLNVELAGASAVFYRVYEDAGQAQTALVLLNKGDQPRTTQVSTWLQRGQWRDGFTGQAVKVGRQLKVEVPAHGVRVFLLDGPVTRSDLREATLRATPKQ